MCGELKMKKQTLVGIFGAVILLSACSLSVGAPGTPTPVDQVGTIVAMTMQALTSSPGQGTPTPVQPNGLPVSYENVSPWGFPPGGGEVSATRGESRADTH